MSSKLLEKLKNAAPKHSQSYTLSESPFFKDRDYCTTNLPILNIALSAKIDGGLHSGITIFAGQSRSFKTLLALYCIKSYLDKYPDAICLYYDTEFGSNEKDFEAFGIDPNRVVHIPINHIEHMKFDMVKRLEAIERGDKVFIFVDSLGLVASKKEVDDAIKENEAADMTRAKAIRSFFRIVTPYFTTKDIPGIFINHIYKTQELFSKNVVTGGTSVMLAANQIFIITREKVEDSNKNIIGFNFNIKIEKSRFVKEQSKFSFLVEYGLGISKYSGLFDLAKEGNFITKVGKKWAKTGNDKDSYSEKVLNKNKEFWIDLINTTEFPKWISDTYKLGEINMLNEEEHELENYLEEELE